MTIEINEKGSESFYTEVVNVMAQYRLFLKKPGRKLSDYFKQFKALTIAGGLVAVILVLMMIFWGVETMEIVAAAGQAIGIDITTNYPEWSIYQTVFTAASQTEYDIFMYSPAGAEPAAPWSRVRSFMSSEFLGKDNNWSGNFGHYQNPRIDEIIAAIPMTTDEEELKALYTEATKIYLTEVPSFSLMYRPEQFHAVNESVWTNYPEAGDGNNIPPADLTDGYGVAALYHLELVE